MLLEQGTISTERLVKKKKIIMTHETNPIYHQPQPLIKMESNNGAALADSSNSAIHHEGKIKFENSYQYRNHMSFSSSD